MFFDYLWLLKCHFLLLFLPLSSYRRILLFCWVTLVQAKWSGRMFFKSLIPHELCQVMMLNLFLQAFTGQHQVTPSTAWSKACSLQWWVMASWSNHLHSKKSILSTPSLCIPDDHPNKPQFSLKIYYQKWLDQRNKCNCHDDWSILKMTF